MKFLENIISYRFYSSLLGALKTNRNWNLTKIRIKWVRRFSRSTSIKSIPNLNRVIFKLKNLNVSSTIIRNFFWNETRSFGKGEMIKYYAEKFLLTFDWPFLARFVSISVRNLWLSWDYRIWPNRLRLRFPHTSNKTLRLHLSLKVPLLRNIIFKKSVETYCYNLECTYHTRIYIFGLSDIVR